MTTPATTARDVRPERLQTATLAHWLYGRAAGPALDDAAEAYHEASKIYPSFAARDTSGVRLLETTPQLQASVIRAVKRHGNRPSVPLPQPDLPATTLADAILARRSCRSFAAAPLSLAAVATLLHSAYGVTHRSRLPDGRLGQPLRAVPSGGALYPLELYLLVQRVDTLEPGLYHYDPLRHLLERLPEHAAYRPAELTAYPELLEPAGVVLLVTAMFWRTRFKYALRGYRFALLEAGHVGQNLMLAAVALELAAVPVGGVYDRRVEDVLGVDGVDESLVYVLSVGGDGEGEAG